MFDRRGALLPFVLLVVCISWIVGCSGGSGESEWPAEPDAAMEHIAHRLADGRVEVVWQALPASYRTDVEGLVHDFAKVMDDEVWDRSFGVMRKLVMVLDEKRSFILDHPMIASQVDPSNDPAENWDDVVGALKTITTSQISTIDGMRQLDVEAFLRDTGGELVERLRHASALTADDKFAVQMDALASTKASIVARTGETVTVRVETPGQPAREEKLVRVEDRWIPEEIARDWNGTMARARAKIDEMARGMKGSERQALLMQLGMAEAALDGLLQADSAEEFQASMGSIAGLAMSAMMSQAAASNSAGGGTLSMGAPPTPPAEPTWGTIDEKPSDAAVIADPRAHALEAESAADELIAATQADTYLEREIVDPELAEPAEEEEPALVVAAGEADKLLGERVVVDLVDGKRIHGLLAEIRAKQVILERELGDGHVAFSLEKSEIETLTQSR